MTTIENARQFASTVTANGSLVAGKHNPVDATGGALTLTLPTPATVGAHLSVEKRDVSTNTVTVSGSIRGTATTLALAWQYESVTLRWDGATWVPTEGHKTKTAMDAAYNLPSIVTAATVGSSTAVPVITYDAKGRITGTSTATITGGGGASLNSSLDATYYVSKSGSDTNDGRSWATPYLTVAKALTTLASTTGTVNVGAGTFNESGIVLGVKQRIVGAGRNATILQLAANGTLVSLVNQSDGGLEHLQLKFASASITGSLLTLNNSFRFYFHDVRFVGQSASGQVGTVLNNNAGDSHFVRCEYWFLGIGIQNDTTVNVWTDGTFVGNTYGYQTLDQISSSKRAGAVISNCTFVDTGTTYIDILGACFAHHILGCWFDGGATTGINVGSANGGPTLLTVRDSPNLSGATTSLKLNAADFVDLCGVQFGNTGSNPTEISIPTPANVVHGRISACATFQTGHVLESAVPASWDGYVGYATSGDTTVDLIETTKWYRVNYTTGKTQRRIVVRMNGRSSGTAAATLTFPSAFETGAFAAVFNNSGITPTITSTSITIPTGTAISDKLIIIEGF